MKKTERLELPSVEVWTAAAAFEQTLGVVSDQRFGRWDFLLSWCCLLGDV